MKSTQISHNEMISYASINPDIIIIISASSIESIYNSSNCKTTLYFIYLFLSVQPQHLLHLQSIYLELRRYSGILKFLIQKAHTTFLNRFNGLDEF